MKSSKKGWQSNLDMQHKDRRKINKILYLETWNEKSKSKFHPKTGHGNPEGGHSYSSTLSLTWVLYVGGWLARRPGRFTPGKAPVTHCKSGRVRKFSPPPGFYPRTFHLIASRYTDLHIPRSWNRLLHFKTHQMRPHTYNIWFNIIVVIVEELLHNLKSVSQFNVINQLVFMEDLVTAAWILPPYDLIYFKINCHYFRKYVFCFLSAVFVFSLLLKVKLHSSLHYALHCSFTNSAIGFQSLLCIALNGALKFLQTQLGI